MCVGRREARVRGRLGSIKLDGDLIFDVLEDVLLHESVENEVRLVERAEGDSAH